MISSARRPFFIDQLFEAWSLRSTVNCLPIDTPGRQIGRSPGAESNVGVLEDAACRPPAREPLGVSSEGDLVYNGEETRMKESEDKARVRKGLGGVKGEAGGRGDF